MAPLARWESLDCRLRRIIHAEDWELAPQRLYKKDSALYTSWDLGVVAPIGL